MSTTVDKTLDRIRAALASGRITKRELARRSGLRHGHLLYCERDTWNPTAEVIRKLERGLASRPLGSARVKSDVRSVVAA